MDAWRIPGVASFAFCLFFSKLIAYTFLYWLPYYIKSTPIEGRKLDAKEAGDLSVLFDVGGVAGGGKGRGGRGRGGPTCLEIGGVCRVVTCVQVMYMYTWAFRHQCGCLRLTRTCT